MTVWYFVSAWLEKDDQQVHFEVANEDGEQFFFWMDASLVNDRLARFGSNVLDRFYYVEEDMLGLAVAYMEDESVLPETETYISSSVFDRYFHG